MSTQQPTSPQANILIADDAPNNLRLLFGMLTEQDYRVRPVPNGHRALATVQAELPDLILLDIMMPDMDGYEVCQRLKADERTRDIPVIFISGLSETFDKVKAFSVGGVDYITKPFQIEEVLARVKTHLHLRHLQKSLQQEIAGRTQIEEELRECNHRLEETNQQLQEVNACKDKFFSILAHDLRNPFSALIGMTEILVEDFDLYGEDKVRVMISRLHTSSKNVYALLANLLEWSRLQRGHMECAPETISLADLAEQNVQLFSSHAESKQITSRNLIPQGTIAYADPAMIDTVLRNLISNALKFTCVGGTVEISSQQQDDNFVEIAVSDTGIGIDQESIDKLFRIDVKYSQKGTDGEQGTGLGLILCKELIEKNGGTLQVGSEVGKGTTFRFTLPRRPL